MLNQMKRSYTIWKKEVISDEIIIKEFIILTEGKIEIPEGIVLNDYRDILQTPTPNNNQSKSKKRSHTFRRNK